FIALRAEWARARARAKRWHEEVLRIQQEMDNVNRYCIAMADRWERASRNRNDERVPDEVTGEGLRSYAYRQADMFCGMRDSFANLWVFIRQDATALLERYPAVQYPQQIAASS
ncbi:hypothetical protein FA95DRAFT_1506886, partial [Auriscalpium vulgare]